ncbi:MAG: GerMN domain-containing protein [Spirochaetales bacterium]|nr:GerMN domain-containing protein [Spirochaetales bacterium]
MKVYVKFLPYLFGGLFISVLLASIFLFAFSENWAKRVLFFPHVNSTKIIGEARFLPDLGNQKDNVMLLVDEIMAGPYKYGNLPVIPETTKLKSAIIDNDILYVNFSKEVFKIDKLVLITPKDMLQAFANSVCYNFPGIKKVYFFIEGLPVSDYSEINKLHFYKYLKDFIITDITQLGKQVSRLKDNPILEYCAGLKAHDNFQNGIAFSADIIE